MTNQDIKNELLKNGDDNYNNIYELLEKVPPPPWRNYNNNKDNKNCNKNKDNKDCNKNKDIYVPIGDELEVLKASIYLRRPILITGKPGLGKSALAKAVVKALDLGELLHWQITTDSTLKDALYSYDAIGRLQDIQLDKNNKKNISTKIESYLKLQALGTAFSSKKLRVLLIDELDKSDADLPNSLLHIFEEGYFEIPELKRLKGNDTKKIKTIDNKKVKIKKGKVQCTYFPIVIITSNGERDFPPAFNRRCLHIEIEPPKKPELVKIVKSNLGIDITEDDTLLELFVDKRGEADDNIATDQLLNAIFLRSKGIITKDDIESLKDNKLVEKIFKPLID